MVFSNLNPNFKVSAFFEVECHCLGSDFGLVLCQMWDQVFDLEIDYLVHLCAPPGRGSVAGRKFLAPPCYSHRAVFASLWALFSSVLCGDYYFRPLFNQRLSSDYFWFGQVGSPITPQRRTFGDWWCEFLHVWCRSCHQSNRIKSLMELCMLPVHGIKIHIYVRIMHWFV